MGAFVGFMIVGIVICIVVINQLEIVLGQLRQIAKLLDDQEGKEE